MKTEPITFYDLDDLVRRMTETSEADSLRIRAQGTIAANANRAHVRLVADNETNCDCDGCVATRLNEEANGYAE
jgi:hypothetical protein